MGNRKSLKRNDTYAIQLLYESDTYVVAHTRYYTGKPGVGVANVFEVVDKPRAKVVLLQDGMAKAFDAQIKHWRAETPTQNDVEAALSNFAFFAQLPAIQQ